MLVLTVIFLPIFAFVFIDLVGEVPSKRLETPFVLAVVKDNENVIALTGQVNDIQIDDKDWRISKSGKSVKGMYGLFVQGRNKAKLRVYWESDGGVETLHIWKITNAMPGGLDRVIWESTGSTGSVLDN